MERPGENLLFQTLYGLPQLAEIVANGVIPNRSQEYIAYVKTILAEQIPARCPRMPDLLAEHINFILCYKLRDACVSKGLWVLVDKAWTKTLATWIGKRRVLEVMAGGGWIAKALSDHGVAVTATDQFGPQWAKRHVNLPKWPDLTIQKMGARKAVTVYDAAEVLLISWPPYGSNEIVRVMDVWGTTRPVIYIGEIDGCNAGQKFFDHFVTDETAPEIRIPQWPGLHDHLIIGHWRR